MLYLNVFPSIDNSILISYLTLTNVVFELRRSRLWYIPIGNLTLTNVVFE